MPMTPSFIERLAVELNEMSRATIIANSYFTFKSILHYTIARCPSLGHVQGSSKIALILPAIIMRASTAPTKPNACNSRMR